MEWYSVRHRRITVPDPVDLDPLRQTIEPSHECSGHSSTTVTPMQRSFLVMVYTGRLARSQHFQVLLLSQYQASR